VKLFTKLYVNFSPTGKKNKGHGMMSRAEAQEMDRSKSSVLVLMPA
jgi:hypothetical protein